MTMVMLMMKENSNDISEVSKTVTGWKISNLITKRLIIFGKSALAFFISAFVSAFVSLPVFIPMQIAEANTSKHFEFTCQTSEADFYDWIELELWPSSVSSPFGRNLDAAFDALTSETKDKWRITIPSQECESDILMESRRESLYSMIEDAAQGGFGRVDRLP